MLHQWSFFRNSTFPYQWDFGGLLRVQWWIKLLVWWWDSQSLGFLYHPNGCSSISRWGVVHQCGFIFNKRRVSHQCVLKPIVTLDLFIDRTSLGPNSDFVYFCFNHFQQWNMKNIWKVDLFYNQTFKISKLRPSPLGHGLVHWSSEGEAWSARVGDWFFGWNRLRSKIFIGWWFDDDRMGIWFVDH